MFKLRTPQARGLAVAALVVGCAASVWRYSENPPGHIIQSSAITQRVANSRAAFVFLPDTRTAQEKADKSWHFDIAFDVKGSHSCGYNILNPGRAWPRDVPMFLVHWGVFLCNEAQAPEEFLTEMRPYLREAAIRDIGNYASKVLAIPFFGLLAAAAFIFLALGSLRLVSWVRTGF